MFVNSFFERETIFGLLRSSVVCGEAWSGELIV